MIISGSASQTPRLRLAVLLLAAGEGSRLGSIPKGLLKKDGDTLLRRFCLATKLLKPVEFVVVSGFHAEVIEAELNQITADGLISLAIARNPNPQQGQSSSIRLGLEALKSEFDVLLITLSDLSEIGLLEISTLLEEFSRRTEGQEIVLPMVNGQRGNPVLFSAKAIANILSEPEMVCRPYMDIHPSQVRSMVTLNSAYILDVDTQEDVQKLGLSFN